MKESTVSVFEKCNRLIGKLGAMSAALASTLLIVVCTTGFSNTAEPPPDVATDVQPFVGTWQAMFEGKVFQVVTLELKNGKLTGSVSRGHIDLNEDGVMTGAELKEGSDPIIESKLDGKILRLTTPDRADNQASDAKPGTNTFEMTLTAKDEATIMPVDDEIKKEMPKFKPWKLERVKK
jgi:hypothetical protein